MSQDRHSTRLDREYNEKRDFVRVHMADPMLIKNIDSEESMTGICKDLSATGVSFESIRNFPEGTELQITINSANDKVAKFKATVKVLWSQLNNQTGSYTIGSEITKIF